MEKIKRIAMVAHDNRKKDGFPDLKGLSTQYQGLP